MYRVGIVSYTNVLPFLYGLEKLKSIKLYDEYPSLIAENFFSGKYDIALLPVGALENAGEDIEVITDYCIGAERKVDSVCLYSQVPLNEIKDVVLDFQSTTSVRLMRVLDKFFLKKGFNFVSAKGDEYIREIKGKTAGVVIGDRTFALNDKFAYVYDLAELWNKYTGLPFVFALWVTRKGLLPLSFKKEFNGVLAEGVNDISVVVRKYKISNVLSGSELKDYLQNSISYYLGYDKRTAVNLFLKLLKQL